MTLTLEYTPLNDIPKIVESARSNFRNHRTQSLEFRKEQLRALLRLLKENEGELVDAIKADLNRSKDTEVSGCIEACEYYINNLEELTQNRKAKGFKESDDCFIRLSPLGTILVIGTWNYPVGLVLQPLAGVLAAGNNCVIKPSEVSENTAKVLTRLLRKYMDPEVVYIINGAVEESSLMLKQRFDHIFYTGGAQVAKIVMEAAAKHLTPVTLELGGKCPVIITEHADLAKAAQTIAGWKVANCGQICLTADYVLCPKHLQEELIKQVIDTWTHMFGKDIKACESYPRIINRRQHERLQKVLQSVQSQNKIVFGGNSDVDSLFVEPTIVTNVSLKDDIMQSEIFGPILPIVTCENLDTAIDIVNSIEHPLALYIFTDKREQIDRVLTETRSGSVTANDLGSQYFNPNLPFGGVGQSGMGNYHGKYSVDTFSHHRSVFLRNVHRL